MELHQREDRLRVDGHLGLGPVEPVTGEELLVVLDDAVVNPDHRSVADRMVVGDDRRVTLREVANVDEGLRGVAGSAISSRRALAPPSLLVHVDRPVSTRCA